MQLRDIDLHLLVISISTGTAVGDRHPKEKARFTDVNRAFLNGRNGGIRTRDPLHPMQVRYQAALHSESLELYSQNFSVSGWPAVNPPC
jgi:hypothetical protein